MSCIQLENRSHGDLLGKLVVSHVFAYCNIKINQAPFKRLQLPGIRCIKYFAWEKPYLQRVFEKRHLVENKATASNLPGYESQKAEKTGLRWIKKVLQDTRLLNRNWFAIFLGF